MRGLISKKVQITIKRRIYIWGIVIVMCFTGCQDTMEQQRTEQSGAAERWEETYDSADEEVSEPVLSDETDWEKRKIEILEELAHKEYPDVPEPYQKVLRQYEQLLRVTEGMNWDFVWDEIYGVGWKYIDNYLYGDGRFDNICYSLVDLSGDGFPEMIMGKKSKYSEEWYAYLIYYYDGEDVQLACQGGGRYLMTFYTNGLVELIDTHFISYYQFQEDDQEWRQIVKIDYEHSPDGQTGYLKNDVDAEDPDPSLFEEISEEEYRQIIEQYRTTPIELEWTVLWEVVG